MIVFNRGLARAVRAVARRCVSGRPRGPAPAVVFESRGGTLTVWVKTPDAGLVHAAPTPCADGVAVVPMAVLAAAEGAGADPVELVVGAKLNGEARWVERGVPRTHPFDAILPGRQHRPPDEPAEWHPVGAGFLAALHACGMTTAREPGRYALSRVQVRGKAGQVVGTDGRAALVWGGFALPFGDDALVPAVTAFGTPELARERDVRVGRTETDLVVAAGPWRVVLPVEAGGRFPDVAGVVPRDAPTVANIDPRDAAALAAALPGLPGAAAEHHPVTLDLRGGVVVVRGRDETTGECREVRLDRSPATGPPARVGVNRTLLARALTLGCLTVRVAPGKPLVFEGGDVRLIVAALEHDPAAEPVRPTTVNVSERRTDMNPQTTGNPMNGRHDPPPADPPDPLAAAEELRAALADATAKANRLVTALKTRKREQRALTQAWSSLKALNLGPGGPP